MIERMRSDFVANASHEIRTPLASIQGFIETLRGPAKHDPKARETFLEIMGEEAARMARLVDDLLSLSRIELAAHQPPRERCDPRDALLYAIDRLRPVADKNRVRAGDRDPRHAAADRGRRRPAASAVRQPDRQRDQVWRRGQPRCASRAAALAAAPPDSGPAAGRAAVQVDIVDQGPGIAKEHLPRLTERFYRVETGRTRRLGGTGLGLAIVKHILRRHQGHLAIESTPGAGSTFSVLLPTAARRRASAVTVLS